MEALGALADGAAAARRSTRSSAHYREWIAGQRATMRRACRQADARRPSELLRLARARGRADRAGDRACSRADGDALDAFRVANRAVARALQNAARTSRSPAWRPFQLAFILMNLPGIADPRDSDRETVDLLFFPTGGGKTEAYLGLAAFTLVLRRLRNPRTAGARAPA